MVHGNYYGIQYEVFLSKEIDFYDDLLPIWIETRARIEMKKDGEAGIYKLIVIPYDEIDKQLHKNALFSSYVRENDECLYKKQYEECLRTKKFAMVGQYEKMIRHNTNLPEPITREEFNQLSIQMQKLQHKGLYGNLSQEEWREHDRKYTEIYNQLQVQRIIHDPEYFQEIKDLHTQLLDQVSFDDEQIERIKKVISHPKLEGIISWRGLRLVDGFW
jgi:hypothetical protein